jgi:hypothetical protein
MPNATPNVISDHSDKLALLNLLSIDINGVVYLSMWCDENNDQTNGPQYSARLNTLNSQYAKLSKALWMDWIGDAVTIKAGMQKATDGVNANVKQIQQSINTAQAIVKALGYVDQAITIASKLLAA